MQRHQPYLKYRCECQKALAATLTPNACTPPPRSPPPHPFRRRPHHSSHLRRHVQPYAISPILCLQVPPALTEPHSSHDVANRSPDTQQTRVKPLCCSTSDSSLSESAERHASASQAPNPEAPEPSTLKHLLGDTGATTARHCGYCHPRYLPVPPRISSRTDTAPASTQPLPPPPLPGPASPLAQ
jgi:hypothetical protein